MRIALASAPLLFGLALPALAADPPPPPPPSEITQGFDLLGEGARLLFRGLMAEMEPALNDMATSLREMEPVLRLLAEMIGDTANYDPPERLPNGDILIRRKPGAPPIPAPDAAPDPPPDDTLPGGQVDL